jgi:hypothetical protein
LKIYTLSIGSISIAGRERGVSEEYIITFTNFYLESSSYLVTIQIPNYIVTDIYTTRIRGSIYDISISTDIVIKAK